MAGCFARPLGLVRSRREVWFQNSRAMWYADLRYNIGSAGVRDGKDVYVSQPFFKETFSSSLDMMGEAIERALTALLDSDWIDEEQVFHARLCLEEALVNAIVHGNRSDPERVVRLEIWDEGESCRICVIDEGGGFSVDDVHLPDCHKMHGRGICLIRYCMDDVTYKANENCLEMTMRRKSLCKGGIGQ